VLTDQGERNAPRIGGLLDQPAQAGGDGGDQRQAERGGLTPDVRGRREKRASRWSTAMPVVVTDLCA